MQIIGFKVIDLIRGTNTVSLYRYLKKVQFLSQEKLEEISKDSLLDLWKEAKELPYYQNFNSYEDLPILTKSILKKEATNFINTRIKKAYRLRKKTGGSTGEPFVYYTGRDSQSYLWAGILLAWDSAGWKPGDKIAFLAGNSILGSGLKKKVFYRLMNVVPFDSFDMSSKRMKRFLLELERSQIKFIYGYANAIFHLASFNLKSGLNVKLTSVITTAENLTDFMRDLIQRSFGGMVFNQYGCNDAGLSAFECEYHNGLHLINTRAYFEVVNKRLISTDTKNNVMPMIRYDSGDRVELSAIRCQCGRGFPLIKEIYGRSNDCVINVKSGAIIHSEFFNHLFREDEDISSFQIHLCGNLLKVIVQLMPEVQNLYRKEKYVQIIQQKTGFEQVEFLFHKDLFKSENGKTPLIVKCME